MKFPDCKCGSGLPATLLRNVVLEDGRTAVRLFCSECAPKPEKAVDEVYSAPSRDAE